MRLSRRLRLLRLRLSLLVGRRRVGGGSSGWGLLPRGGRGRRAAADGETSSRSRTRSRSTRSRTRTRGLSARGASPGGRLPLGGRGAGGFIRGGARGARWGASRSRLRVSRGPPGAPDARAGWRGGRGFLSQELHLRGSRGRSRCAVAAAIAAVEPAVVSARARGGGDDGVAAAEAEAAGTKVRRDGGGVDGTGTREGRAGGGDPGGGGGGRRGRRRAHQTAGGASNEHGRGRAGCPGGPRARSARLGRRASGRGGAIPGRRGIPRAARGDRSKR